jgi:hypothetical protein
MMSLGFCISHWEDPSKPLLISIYHPGAVYEMRSKDVGHSSNQCTYKADGALITSQPAAGTADFYSTLHKVDHYGHDMKTFDLAEDLNQISDYYLVRPTW